MKINADISPADLAQIVTSVFRVMMHLDVSGGGTPWFAGRERLTASVHLSGDWNGAVVLECDGRQACQLAGRLLSCDPPETVDDDVRDVLGELANMIGGNLKCLLPRGIHLSMPAVVDGADYSLRFCGAELLERLAFQSDEGPFWVAILSTPA